MAHVQYLTVQDLIWIHFEITKTVAPYKFNLLEDGTFFQYGYGKSVNVLAQAGKFLPGFVAKAPFAMANEATAFVATVAFLELNGFEFLMRDAEAAEWITGVLQQDSAEQAIRVNAKESHDAGHDRSVKEVVMGILDRYPKTIADLLPSVAA